LTEDRVARDRSVQNRRTIVPILARASARALFQQPEIYGISTNVTDDEKCNPNPFTRSSVFAPMPYLVSPRHAAKAREAVHA